jgi:Ubiquitin interaction motif
MAPQNPSAAGRAAAHQSPEDHFQARPSNRLGRNAPGVAQADGSTWQEYLAVCDVQEKLQIRSYFQNLTTGKRVWDEPPSGASHIIPASEEMHRMATLQLDELYVATTNGEGDGNKNDKKSDKEKKKSGLKSLFGLGRNKTRDNNATSSSNGGSTNNKKIQYKSGSSLLAGSNSRVDPHLQAAIAQSIAESQGIPSSLSNTDNAVNPSSGSHQEADPDLAMAMALSLSTAGAASSPKTLNEEEEMLRRALEESKLESASGKRRSPNRSSRS